MNDNIYQQLNYYNTKSANSIVLSKDPDVINIKEYIISNTSFLDLVYKNPSIKLRIKCLIRSIIDVPVCNSYECNNKVKVSDKHIFNKFCSVKCRSANNIQMPVKSKELLMDKDWLYNQYVVLEKSKSQIANELDVKMINKYFKLHGIEMRDFKMSSTNYDKLTDKDWLYTKYIKDNMTMLDIANLIGVSKSTVQIWVNKFRLDISPSNSYPRKIPKVSSYEKEILDILDSLNISYISSDRAVLNGLELDIYIPDYNFAIEFDGLIWHSELFGKKDNKYHLNKTNLCERKGIHLFHIFEDEWLENKDIIISMIKNKLKLNDRVYARKCTILEVDKYTEKQFLNDNHIQGYTPSQVATGLYYDGILYSLMTFTKPRFNKNYDIELLRFATKKGCTVVGGGSKLISTIKNKSIISYADRRYSQGNVYLKTGFTVKTVNKPQYHYTKNNNRYRRTSFQKKYLPNKLNEFDDTLTEWHNMINNGYDRIWDCGTIAFVKEI